MPQLEQSSVRNRLLRAMHPDDFALLAPHLTSHEAKKGAVLLEQGASIEHVWFMESGVGSIITISPEGLRAETGLFGRDGFTPVTAILGNDRNPNLVIVQVPDDNLRMPLGPLLAAIDRSPGLRILLLRYVQTLSIQTSCTALSNAVHPVDERLARWILMCHDRIDGNELVLTHDFMSIMLAVRRPSVTTSLHVLEGNGFIRSERSCIIIRNREAMEEFAGDSYGKPEREYERLIGPMR